MPKEKPRILVVEDEVVVALDIQTRLIRMGYQVIGRCATGEEAVPLALELKPDLLLMDIMLAGRLNGIAAAHQIRSKLDVPVIFLTAYSDDATLRLSKLAEPFGYIVKPFDERTLRTTIEITLERHRTQRQERTPRRPSAASGR
jgi:DNA-binding response OmpR family regulator